MLSDSFCIVWLCNIFIFSYSDDTIIVHVHRSFEKVKPRFGKLVMSINRIESARKTNIKHHHESRDLVQEFL